MTNNRSKYVTLYHSPSFQIPKFFVLILSTYNFLHLFVCEQRTHRPFIIRAGRINWIGGGSLTDSRKKAPATPARLWNLSLRRPVMYDGSAEDLCPRREPANGPFIRYRNMEILPRWCLGLLRGTPTHLESVILPWAKPAYPFPPLPHAPNIRSINREQVYICHREVSLYSFPRNPASPSFRPFQVRRNRKERGEKNTRR